MADIEAATRAREALISVERLRSLLAYDPDSGVITWRVARGGRPAGRIANTRHGAGYLLVTLDGRKYLAHRVAWALMTGAWPSAHIDHRDLRKDRNVWSNLRRATRSQNMANTNAPSTNRSGFKGVCWCATKRRWKASAYLGSRHRHLGYFKCPEQAAEAYARAVTAARGEYARTTTTHNRTEGRHDGPSIEHCV